MLEYLPILIFLFMAIAVSVGAISFSLILGKKKSVQGKGINL